MRTITMQTIKDGKLSGEILEDGKYWQIDLINSYAIIRA